VAARGLLQAGQRPEVAAAAAVGALEASPATNAGRGSNLTEDGAVEADASVMAGDGAFGAVGAAAGRTRALPAHSQWQFFCGACRSIRFLPRSATAGALPERLQVAHSRLPSRPPLPTGDALVSNQQSRGCA